MDVATNDAYQNAIWFIEGEGGENNALVTEANLAVAMGGSWYRHGARPGAGPEPGVGCGLRECKAGDRAQDVLTAVPDGGATLTLLGFALLGLGALRRKF